MQFISNFCYYFLRSGFLVLFGISVESVAIDQIHHSLTQVTGRPEIGAGNNEYSQFLGILTRLQAGREISLQERAMIRRLFNDLPGVRPSGDDLKDLEAIFAWRGYLPCDLSQVRGTMRVRLAGEVHSGIRLSDEAQHYRTMAEEGRMLFGYEGGFTYPTENSYDIEGLTPRTIALILKRRGDLRIQLRNEGVAHDTPLPAEIVASFTEIDVSLIGHVARPLRGSKLETLLQLLDRLAPINARLNNRGNADWTAQNQRDFDERERIHNSIASLRVTFQDVDSLLNIFIQSLLGSADSPTGRFLNLLPNSVHERDIQNLRQLSSRFDNLPQTESSERFLDALDGPLRRWRDRWMAHEARKLICRAVRQRINWVVIRSGYSHLPGIYQELARTQEAIGQPSFNIQVQHDTFYMRLVAEPRLQSRDRPTRETGENMVNFFAKLPSGTLIIRDGPRNAPDLNWGESRYRFIEYIPPRLRTVPHDSYRFTPHQPSTDNIRPVRNY